MTSKSKLSTESYKGVRDFYPEDMFVENFIWRAWRDVVESFGYVEYGASILEPAELYRVKSGEEIVNEQTYTFIDRGEREVTLRPEMTPTVARMIAGREHDLTFPVRWYSIPNLFRYEKPQRGRLREHWQLNVDLFGVDSTDADAEIISVAHAIMRKLGASDADFVIKLNSRKLMRDVYAHFALTDDQAYKMSKIIDKKHKIPAETFLASVGEILGDAGVSEKFVALLASNEKLLETLGAGQGTQIPGGGNENAAALVVLIESLQKSGITNIEFDPTLMRGFDYYTGMVFEVFDTHPDNNRSVFGGGRYDDLLDIFDARKVPAVGFGAGDVTARDFLETHKLLPTYKPTTDVYICTLGTEVAEHARALAETLRKEKLNVALDLSGKKLGDQIKIASKQSIPYVLVVGPDEITSGIYPLKNLADGLEKKVKVEEIAGVINSIK